MSSSLLLDRTAWDLVLDASGNIAVCTVAYAAAQDVACALRCFVGDCFFDQSLGVPYWEKILGQYPPEKLVRQKLVAEAMKQKNVRSAQIISLSTTDRAMSGEIQLTLTDGTTTKVSF